MRRSWLTALLVVSLAPAGLHARQVVIGQVVDSTTGQPVPRGFVVLMDSGGNDLGRALAGADGRFVFAAPDGRYQLRSQRIGYRVWLSEPFRLRRPDTLLMDLRVSAIPARLAEVSVRGETECRPAWERIDTGTLWEEARKAIEAAAWTGGQRRYRYRLHQFTESRPRGRRATEVIRQTDGTVSQPFRADNLDRLMERGYVRREPPGRWNYYAPDAFTLLDSRFHGTHCFGTRLGRGDDRGLLGLTFVPLESRSVPDVRGTIWMDSATSELRRIDYEYTRLPSSIPRGSYGGTIGFSPLASGAWIIHDWIIRVPLRSDRSALQNLGGGGRAGMFHEGARVIEAFDLSGNREFIHPDAVHVTGTVLDSTGRSPWGNSAVVIPGTGYRAAANELGQYAFNALLEGEYPLTLARLDSLGYTREVANVRFVPGDTLRVDLRMPSLRTVHRNVCGNAPGPDRFVVVGRVIDANAGTPVDGVRVEARWDESVARDRSDRNGWFSLCGLRTDRMVQVGLEDQPANQRATVRFADGIVLERIGSRERRLSAPERIWRLDFSVTTGR